MHAQLEEAAHAEEMANSQGAKASLLGHGHAIPH